jgi:spore germination protein YaaH
MEKALRLLTEAGAELTWDTEAGQYYGEYEENGSLHRIWLEDATSLQRKLDVTASYDLAGVAFWKLGLEADNVWEEISRYLAD